MARLELKNLSKRYPDGTVGLAGLDLTVEEGELLVCVGPSGCGKSTLLRLLAGLEAPSGGSIALDGAVVNDWPPQRRNVAMVFQNYALYPHMSVRDNLAFPLKMRGTARPTVAARVAETAELLGLAPLLDQRPAQLSGGQRQRVAMGRALVRQPSLFLMDEPLSNLDARLRVQLRGEIAALQRRTGTTTLYVTHDQVEAMTLGDRVAVLAAGRLRQVAPPRILYERPDDTFVAGFIGSPPMNLLGGELGAGGAGLLLRLGGQRIALPPRVVAGWPLLGHHLGEPLVVGVRPEALALVAPGEEAHLRARVTAVESLGHEQLLYCEPPAPLLDPLDPRRPLAGASVAVRLPAGIALSAGDEVGLSVDLARLHWFDGRTGRRLNAAGVRR